MYISPVQLLHGQKLVEPLGSGSPRQRDHELSTLGNRGLGKGQKSGCSLSGESIRIGKSEKLRLHHDQYTGTI